MIRKINNEYLKIGYVKIIISIILIVSLLVLLNDYNSNINEYLYIMETFIGLDICILFSGIISNEFDSGTFRYFLTKPEKRYKVFIYKYLSIIIYIFVLLITICIVYTILAKKYIREDILLICKNSIPLFTMSSIIVMLSSLFKSTSFSTSFSISIYILSNLISQIFFNLKFTLIEYTFFPYLDYSIFNDLESLSNMNELLNTNLSIKRGIVIDILYTVIIFVISIVIFNKKDIKN